MAVAHGTALTMKSQLLSLSSFFSGPQDLHIWLSISASYIIINMLFIHFDKLYAFNRRFLLPKVQAGEEMQILILTEVTEHVNMMCSVNFLCH